MSYISMLLFIAMLYGCSSQSMSEENAKDEQEKEEAYAEDVEGEAADATEEVSSVEYDPVMTERAIQLSNDLIELLPLLQDSTLDEDLRAEVMSQILNSFSPDAKVVIHDESALLEPFLQNVNEGSSTIPELGDGHFTEDGPNRLNMLLENGHSLIIDYSWREVTKIFGKDTVSSEVVRLERVAYQ